MYGILGSLVLIGYVLMITKMDVESVWSNNNTNIVHKIKWIYKIMIALSFIAGLYLIYYLYKFCPKNDPIIYSGSILLLLFSIVWAFKPFFYPSIILGLVFMGAILLLVGICLLIDKRNGTWADVWNVLALLSICIIVIQTGFFDLGIWTGNIKFITY